MVDGDRPPSADQAVPKTPATMSGIDAADVTCRARGVQLTSTRKQVLQILWEAARPMKAYDILTHMEGILDRRLAPPTVYRALDFLLEQGFVARIESKNAFVPCAHPDHPHVCVFFICENCGASREFENPTLERLFVRDAASLGFRLSKRIVELQGTCAACLASPQASAAQAI